MRRNPRRPETRSTEFLDPELSAVVPEDVVLGKVVVVVRVLEGSSEMLPEV